MEIEDPKRFLEKYDEWMRFKDHYDSEMRSEERIDFISQYQPERLNPEACENGCLNTKPENRLKNDGWKCEKCRAIITRCDSLTSMET